MSDQAYDQTSDPAPWCEERAIRIATDYKATGLAPFGDAPLEFLTGEARATKGIADSLLELLTSCPDEQGRGLLARLVAERMVVETLRAEGRDLHAMTKLLLDYTDGTPTHREKQIDAGESRERIVTLTQRAEGYVVEPRVDGTNGTNGHATNGHANGNGAG